MAAKETVPRGVIYCCVPLCYWYKCKVVNGKTIKLQNFQRITKQEGFESLHSEMCVKSFLQSLEQECAAYISVKSEEGSKPWCQFPTLFPSKPAAKSPCLLAVYLKHLIVWPCIEIIAADMPECFKKFSNT